MYLRLFVTLLLFALTLTQPPEWNHKISQGLLLYSHNETIDHLMPYVGNGYLATQINSDAIYVGGVYNGPATHETTPSHRARIPSLVNIHIHQATVEHSGLDLEHGFYKRRSVVDVNGRNVTVEQTWFAHRRFRNLLVHEIRALDSVEPVRICFTQNIGPKSKDLQITETYDRYFQVWSGKTIEAETPSTPLVSVAVVFTSTGIAYERGTVDVCANVSTSRPYVFMAVAVTSLENQRTVSEAMRMFDEYYHKIQYADLVMMHKHEWETVWKSNMEITGELDIVRSVYSSLYYILSSIRQGWDYSLSPGSLSSNAYNGHVFWDTETWMYPSILMLYPSLARSIINYRLNRLDAAAEKARSYNKGYEGYMFPWESAFSGVETTPTFAETGELEHHITGDIVFAIQQYYYTQRHLLSQSEKLKLFELVKGVALFWTTRVTNRTRSTTTGTQQIYDIDGVIPPDEYSVNVNNSIYTNAVAQISLDFAIELARDLGISPDPKWAEVSRGLYSTYNPQLKIHDQHEGYAGQLIKQADVVLLGFPLCWKGLQQYPDARMEELKYYESRTDHRGPAMTWSMHSIGWLEKKEMNHAHELFTRSYLNIKKPFYVWQETPTEGAVNFITGAGGFLQNVLFGYGGLRIERDQLKWNPLLMHDVNHIRFKGLHYHGHVFEISYDSRNVNILLIQQGFRSLFIKDARGIERQLGVGKVVTISRDAFTMFIR